ncbi:MAG: Short-chain fatty acids transporter [Firmicutes bacterium ADurb.Bin182]|nr:MAG: Short-chain fatty acids transporter [Firmicutes bacterium ADurb.Bin182]
MFKKFTNGCVKLVNKYLPDPFLFAIILTIVTFIGALIATGMGPIEVLSNWGADTGIWGLLSFAMQMVLVLVLGGAMASANAVKKALNAIASLAKTPRDGIMITAFVSAIFCWLNWGFGLIVGALLARAIARRINGVDYRLLIASAYAGFVVWHAGTSGSIPLNLAGEGVLEKMSGGLLTGVVPSSETIFHPINLLISGVIIVGLPFLCWAMMPTAENTITVDPALLVEKEAKTYKKDTPAEKMENSRILWLITIVLGFGYIVYYFVTKGFNLSLNVVNMIFLFLGILMHGNLRKYIDAIADAAGGAAGIILQFPFYAGIMGLMVAKNEAGVSLAGVISNFFVSISNGLTYPLFTFWAAGIVNFFVPSGGGQWAVQGPIMMPATATLNVPAGQTAMAIAWGDAWTNMIQPFWALPALGIAGLSAKDIMGYCVVVTLATGIVISGGMLLWAFLF